MSSIDDRVVNMQFNNAQFQQGISETTNSLGELKDGLKLDGATSGIDTVQQAGNRFSLANMEEAIQNISDKFSVFGAVGFTIIQNLTNTALNAGKSIASGIIDPLVQGGAKRALALQQAKFQFRGLGLDISKTMAVSLAAVKGTAFGLDDAATAAGQFGASGITAGHGLIQALKGIAGVAAQSGSSFESVAQIFEKVAGNGRLMGEDLLSLSSRGINAAATLAKSMGVSEASVRKMVSKGKISFKEFSHAMNDAFGKNAAKANETYAGALSNMHAALARIGADVASPYFLAMRDIFNALGPLFDQIHTAIQPLIDDFGIFQTGAAAKGVLLITKLLGPGLVAAITNIVKAVRAIGAAIGGGFHEIFPDDTATQMRNISNFLKTITAALIPGAKAAGELQRTFAGVFAIFDIVGRIVGSLIGALGELFGFASKGSGSFLSITASIGDFIVKIDQFIKKTDGFKDFFRTIAGIVAVPIGILRTFFGIIADGVENLTGVSTGGFDDFANDINKRFSGLIEIGQFFSTFWGGVVKVATAVWNFLKPIFDTIGNAISKAVHAVGDALSGLTFDQGIKLLNTGIFATLVLVIRGFFGNLGGVIAGNGVAIVSKFKLVFGQLQLNLKALELSTNASTLKSIAISIALLAASAVALSLVDPVKLGLALVTMKVMITELLAALKAFSAMTGTKGLLETLALALALQVIAGAILTLSAAVALLGALPMQNIIQGVLAIAAIMGILIGTLKAVAKSGGDVLFAAGAIALIAPAILVLAGALAILGAIPLANLVQGMVGFAVMLGLLVVALDAVSEAGPEVLIAAGAIALIAPAIATLAGVIALLGALPSDNLMQGMVGLAAALLILVLAMNGLSDAGPSILLGGVAMVLAAVAITILAGALKIVATMSWDDIGRTMVVLAGSLIILAAAMVVMGVPLVALGAVAMIIAAGAIAILAPALLLLSTISWDGIGRGLTILAASLAIMAVLGVAMIPGSVGFLLLGVAILLIGEGALAAGTGIGLLAAGIAALVVVGAGGIALFSLAIKSFIELLPSLGTGIGLAFVNMVVAIGAQAPQLINAFVQVLLAMLNAIDQVVPRIIQVATDLIVALVNALVVLVPKLVEAGLTIIQALLRSISNHVGDITKYGIQIIINFINAVAKKLPDVIKAGGNLILSYINGMAKYIKDNSGKFVTAGRNLFNAVVDGIAKAIAAGGSAIRSAGAKIGNALIQGARNALGIASPSKVFRYFIMGNVFGGLEQGNKDNLNRAANIGTSVGETITSSAVEAVKKSVAGISDAMATSIDAQPTIRPVLDLSDIQDKANQMQGILQAPKLSVDTSNEVATSVALQEETRNMELSQQAEIDPKTGQVINFTQNNTSPKALSTGEVYRQTKNQLSTLKGELGVVDQSGSPQ